MKDKPIIFKPRSQGLSLLAAQEFAASLPLLPTLPLPLLTEPMRVRKTYSAGDGPVTAPIQRAEPKRPVGMSARQWKKLRGKGKGR